MNKAILFSIRPQWTKMIFNGDKQYEFRNKLPKDIKSGMKVYVYETLGKQKTVRKFSDMIDKFYRETVHEGLGMVVGEFTIKSFHAIYDGAKIYKSDVVNAHKYVMFSKDGYVTQILGTKYELQKQGYTNQKYAIEITDVIKYDEDWLQDRQCEIENHGGTSDGTAIVVDWDYFDKVSNAPTSPLPITDFVAWNKHTKWLEKTNSMVDKQSQFKLTTAPQSFCYVVEKEELK